MAKPRDKKIKQGRNDPCWCGSGKKYKDCHFIVEQTQRGEQLRLRQAQDTLFPRLVEAAQSIPEAFPAAFEYFWDDKYTPDQMGELDELEDRGAERFLTWFVFDHTVDNELTLIKKLLQVTIHGGFDADDYEHRLLQAWKDVRLRPYVVDEVRKGHGLIVHDLLDEDVYEVTDHAAAKRMAEGEVLIGHLVPVGGQGMITPADGVDPPYGREISPTPSYFVAGAMAQLTSDTADKLLEFASLHLEDLRRSQPDATWSDLLRQRSYVLNHFVMELPQEEYDANLLDNIVLRTRVALELTGASLSGLVGREKRNDEE